MDAKEFLDRLKKGKRLYGTAVLSFLSMAFGRKENRGGFCIYRYGTHSF